MRTITPDKICLHCKSPAKIHARGLCKTCHRDKSVRVLYPCAFTYLSLDEEELDRMIAERMPTLPRTNGNKRLPELPVAVVRGKTK